MNHYEFVDRLTRPHLDLTVSVIDNLVQAAAELRDAKNYEGSDKIRDALARCNVALTFPKDRPPQWSFM